MEEGTIEFLNQCQYYKLTTDCVFHYGSHLIRSTSVPTVVTIFAEIMSTGPLCALRHAAGTLQTIFASYASTPPSDLFTILVDRSIRRRILSVSCCSRSFYFNRNWLPIRRFESCQTSFIFIFRKESIWHHFINSSKILIISLYAVTSIPRSVLL